MLKLDEPLVFESKSKKLKAIPLWVFSLFSAIIAFLLVNYFFSPRFVFWKGLDVPLAWVYPEVNRAVNALKQIQHPFEPINNPTNDVIQWRLLFPLLAHYLAIPKVVFLTIPHIGCILVLGWITILTYGQAQSQIEAMIASVLFATSSWFFVSSGWLAYFDSWYVLGLMLAAFHPSRSWIVVSCLFVPWIDERFVLALPMTMLVRAIYFDRSFYSRPFLYDALAIFLTITPWIAFRMYLIYSAIDSSPSVMAWQIDVGQRGIFFSVADGWWNGLRGLWAYPVLFCFISVRRETMIRSALLVAAALVTQVLNIRLAGDLSRSVSNLMPFVALGFFESIRSPSFPWRNLLFGLTAFNLLMPAYHVSTGFKLPMFYFPYERFHLNSPPPELTAVFYSDKGVDAWQLRDTKTALEMFSTAIRIDPHFAEGYLNRGVVYLEQGRIEEGEAEIRHAIEVAPTMYEAQYQLAHALVRKGSIADAISILQRILSKAPSTYVRRSEVETLLNELSSR